jgi:carotenoid cleavage dioxygenase-like enzyme
MMNAPPAKSRFLQGPFATVTEEITAFDLPVTGQLPVELNGRYLRNGPNPMSLDDPNYHWFLGTGMVHGVRLRGGRAEWYRNRWVLSNAVANVLGEKWPAGPVQPIAGGSRTVPNNFSKELCNSVSFQPWTARQPVVTLIAWT